ncbi:signal peptide peptidase SppA [Catenovulum sp. SM1970]|uniref:signal peptide peptidase SppA n=1 Tax=Marinifaba aquimaris TaxID=2741323 RepID=UPI0015728B57|nr:signal peptide peptidase SppA [Marinifaba aquimaris]NTS78545.1 signal peptide peptidase SppA [Marinifaba aquimaris]
MSTQKSGIRRVFSALWSFINTSRKIIINLIFFTLLVVFISAMLSDEDKVQVPNETALVLNLEGNLVEQLKPIDPVEKFLNEASGEADPEAEVLVADVVHVLENAKDDNRIKAVVLELSRMNPAGLDKLKAIGQAIESVKEAGKPVFAIGDMYDQSQYFVASYADEIFLNPMGGVFIEGYGSYRLYFKKALENLKITTHIFRVGTFKSAVEPFMREDMSVEAKQANQALLDELWLTYKTEVAQRRNMDIDNFDESLTEFEAKIAKVNGNFAQFAIDNGWVDKLTHRHQYREAIANIAGWESDEVTFNQITYADYLSVVKPPLPLPVTNPNQVGVVVAKGTILDGYQDEGTIGGDSTARLLQKARLDDNVKAVVLRVDSPGGSAFASEVIRKEIDLLQQAGKPVVASMASVAASGGYWISTSADEIWASPTTITGSIGVFGMFMTFENALDYLGVNADGVGTTELAGASPMKELDPRYKAVIQHGVENVYDQFIEMVASNRQMTVEAVDKVGQGRVWTGAQAQQLGLVDELGTLDDAISAAARLADIKEYESKIIERELSPQEIMIRQILGQANTWFDYSDVNDDLQPLKDNKVKAIVNEFIAQYNKVARLNDPQGLYALCEVCPE